MYDFIVQELDRDRNVLFEWHSQGVIPYEDSYVDLDTEVVDYFHGNAVDIDTDGNFLVSARNTSQILKINRQTGEVMWILGGKRNQFQFTNDAGFTAQHDIRRTASGTITLFDNGVWNHPTYSRAVEYSIDEQAKTITRVWEYRHTPDIYGEIMGNAQRFANGNSLIGWGSGPYFSEIKPDGTTAFEMHFDGWMNYRAFRLPWEGKPRKSPVLVAQTQNDTATLFMSWNGATSVASYRLYGAQTYGHQQVLGEYPRDGFETSIALDQVANAAQFCYFQIQPLDSQGNALALSNTVYRQSDTCTQTLPYSAYLPAIDMMP